MITKQNLVDSSYAAGVSGVISVPSAPDHLLSYLVPLLAGVLAPIVKQGGQLALEALNERIRKKQAPDVTPPRSAHFSIEEFACNDGTPVPEHLYPNVQNLMNNLEVIRSVAGPLVVNSGYRSPAYNKRVGGAKGSYHLLGLAADLRPLECSVSELKEHIQYLRHAGTLAAGGLGIYPSFIHFDLGPSRTWYKS